MSKHEKADDKRMKMKYSGTEVQGLIEDSALV